MSMEEPSVNPPQPPSSDPVVTNSKKRPLENDASSQNARQLKLRVILRDLRPHFLEVLRTPDFRNCKAANEIREQMKLMVELYNQNATAPDAPAEKIPGGPTKPGDEKIQTVLTGSEAGDGKESFIVGGSAFGWNFITYAGNDPVYYGVTKEKFRVDNPATIVTQP